jgi:hypothetical protein
MPRFGWLTQGFSANINQIFITKKLPAEMADLLEKRGRGRPPKAKRFPDIAFQLPEGHYEYLRDLVRVKRLLGDTENDAARFILIRELDKMMRGRYPRKGTPNE